MRQYFFTNGDTGFVRGTLFGSNFRSRFKRVRFVHSSPLRLQNSLRLPKREHFVETTTEYCGQALSAKLYIRKVPGSNPGAA
jgi:hypothetical protein